MLTTSNSAVRNDRLAYRLIVAVAIGGTVSCTVPQTAGSPQATPADSPSEAIAAPQPQRPAVANRSALTTRMKIVEEGARELVFDESMRDLAGQQFVRDATDPVAIEVELTEPIDPTPRAATPLIVLNGTDLLSTMVFPGDPFRLLAFLPNRDLLRPRDDPEPDEVEVYWSGSEAATRSAPEELLLLANR